MGTERVGNMNNPSAEGAERRSASLGAMAALLTTAEVAQFLAVSERTVRRLVARGRLPCVRVGGQVRFSPAILARWAERGGK